MIDITNKQERKQLMIRYIEAETTPAEERLLADYFMSHRADDDEVEIARLICIESSHTDILSDKGVEEFDSIMRKSKTKPRILRLSYWIGGVAAVFALILSLNLFQRAESSSDTIEIAHEIQQLMALNMNDIMSITATPVDGGVWIKVELSDGTTKTFIRTEDMGQTTLLAVI